MIPVFSLRCAGGLHSVFSIVVKAASLLASSRGTSITCNRLSSRIRTLTIEVLEGPSLPAWSDCPTVEEFEDAGVKWKDCRTASYGQYTRRLVAALSNQRVLIEYSYSSLATKMAPGTGTHDTVHQDSLRTNHPCIQH